MNPQPDTHDPADEDLAFEFWMHLDESHKSRKDTSETWRWLLGYDAERPTNVPSELDQIDALCFPISFEDKLDVSLDMRPCCYRPSDDLHMIKLIETIRACGGSDALKRLACCLLRGDTDDPAVAEVVRAGIRQSAWSALVPLSDEGSTFAVLAWVQLAGPDIMWEIGIADTRAAWDAREDTGVYPRP